MLISEILFETAAEIREIEALSKMVIDRAKPIWLKKSKNSYPTKSVKSATVSVSRNQSVYSSGCVTGGH